MKLLKGHGAPGYPVAPQTPDVAQQEIAAVAATNAGVPRGKKDQTDDRDAEARGRYHAGGGGSREARESRPLCCVELRWAKSEQGSRTRHGERS